MVQDRTGPKTGLDRPRPDRTEAFRSGQRSILFQFSVFGPLKFRGPSTSFQFQKHFDLCPLLQCCLLRLVLLLLLSPVLFSSTALVVARRSLAGGFVLVSRLLPPWLLAAFLDSRAHGSSAVLLLVKPNLLSVLVRLVENRLSSMARLQICGAMLSEDRSGVGPVRSGPGSARSETDSGPVRSSVQDLTNIRSSVQPAGNGAPQRHLLCSNAAAPNFSNAAGMGPHSWLSLTSRLVKLLAFRFGTEPVSMLCDTLKLDNRARPEREPGRGPEKRLSERSTWERLLSWPRNAGMGPVRLLELSVSTRKLVSLLKD
ncbi:hypothetical protein Cgig2_012133 [Carnegiea gigantea]|uniref:Transmembrane protein n=1 Tax=Carnegiea gigantea TaxID=171969 RepID=A0A9Q1KRQ9_9CARY|nr:hypothetical protein Cgig2_012133 [Carnegiea gigantea]